MAKAKGGRDPVVNFRWPPEMKEAVTRDIEFHNSVPTNEPIDLSEWLRRAVKERLRQRTQSRNKRKKKGGGK